jgi:DNA-binding NtrC family response regulator
MGSRDFFSPREKNAARYLGVKGACTIRAQMNPFIVLVDDDSDKTYLIKRYIERQFPGHEIIAVGSRADAVPYVFTPSSKIVITNGRIAGRDGIAFAARVTREVGAPVIMISLWDKLKQPAIKAGVSAFIEPGDHEGLHEAVTRALDLIESRP